jgi:hypothetical protein
MCVILLGRDKYAGRTHGIASRHSNGSDKALLVSQITEFLKNDLPCMNHRSLRRAVEGRLT